MEKGSNKTISVLIVDDHEVARAGLHRILETDKSLVIIGEASGGKEAIIMTQKLKPDVVIMDLRMSGMDGITATKEIKRIQPQTAVLIFTLYDGDIVKEALEAGASGYVLKDGDARFILESIHQAYEGLYPISSSITRAVMADYAELLKNNRARILTDRQTQIIKLLAEGKNTGQIASQVFVSQSTAKREIKLILKILEASDRAQAVSKAINQKMI
jgi:DNA-binding NarL/FixJ family response regulator